MQNTPDSSPHTDPNAWLERHGDAMYRYALLHLGDATAAEDAVQESLLAAMRAQGRFAGASSERTWLIGILKHKVIDHVRKAARTQPAAELDETKEYVADNFNRHGFWKLAPQPWGSGQEQLIENGEFWNVFSGCLGKMPARLTAVFSLREMDGLSTEEICQLLDLTPTNMWTLLHRARTRLRRCLEQNWFGRDA